MQIALKTLAVLVELACFINTTVQTDIQRILEIETSGRLSLTETQDIAACICQNARKHELSPYLILGVVLTESKGNINAINSADKKKPCLGLMQVSTYWWDKELRKRGIISSNKDYHSISGGIAAGAYVLKKYLNKTGGNIEKALLHYSGGKSSKSNAFKAYFENVTKYNMTWRRGY